MISWQMCLWEMLIMSSCWWLHHCNNNLIIWFQVTITDCSASLSWSSETWDLCVGHVRTKLAQLGILKIFIFGLGISHSSSALLSGQGSGNIISSSSQGNNNSSMVSLHHAVPIEIRSPSSTSSAASSVKSVSTSNKNGKILINTRSNISLSNAISSGQSNLTKNVPSYFVTDPDDEGKRILSH